MNWWQRLFKKEDWQLVETLMFKIHWTDIGEYDRIAYQLFESDRGNRRAEIQESGLAKSWKKGKTTTMYMEVVYPWLNGINFDHIPSYKPANPAPKEKPKKKEYW